MREYGRFDSRVRRALANLPGPGCSLLGYLTIRQQFSAPTWSDTSTGLIPMGCLAPVDAAQLDRRLVGLSDSADAGSGFANVRLMAVLFLPILAGRDEGLYPWTLRPGCATAGRESELPIQAVLSDPQYFTIRAVIYFVV